MIISLVGYMGSGKSHISKVLSQELNLKLIDLDQQISLKNKMTIVEIFEKRGEIYFRKQEREILEEILATQDHIILSVGGGTPAYYNNMEVINQYTESIFLRTSVKNLAERLLKQKQKRPLIAKINDEDITRSRFESWTVLRLKTHIFFNENMKVRIEKSELRTIHKPFYRDKPHQ